MSGSGGEYVEGAAQFGYGVSRAPDGAYTTAQGFGQSRNNVFDSNVYFGNIKPADDPHALTSDPMLGNSEKTTIGRESVNSYVLRSASPMIDSGKLIDPNGGKDFFGSQVPCHGVDRGAAELVDCRGM